MQLVEQGKLDLDAPVDDILPEVAAAKIMVGLIPQNSSMS